MEEHQEHDRNSHQVSFVILNWNQCAMTLDCLESLEKLDYQNYNLIVVDNGSTDHSAETIKQKYPDCIIIENPENLGYSEGNNVGIQYALGLNSNYIFLLNNDTYVDKYLLTRLIDVISKDTNIGIVGPTMYYAEPQNVLWGGHNWIDWHNTRVVREKMGEEIEYQALQNEPPHEVEYIDSCAILVKTEVFTKIGLMDYRYFINFDDIDLCMRVRKAGYKVVYVPSGIIWHRVSAAIGVGSPANTYYMTRNAFLFFSRHSPGILRLINTIRLFFKTVRSTLAWTLKSEYKDEIYRRKSRANIYAMRDYVLGRYGKMGEDVQRVCFGKNV